MKDAVSGRFDAAAAARLAASNGGSLRSDVAIATAQALILQDGKVEDSELAAFDDGFYANMPSDTTAFDPASGVSFEDAEVKFDKSVAYMKEFRPLAGSAVSGSPPKFADPIKMLSNIGQVDALDATTNDHDRCGAAAWVSELVMRGPKALQDGVKALIADPAVPESLKAELRQMDLSKGPITARSLHLVMEAQYSVLNARDPGGSGISLGAMYDQVRNNGGQAGHVELSFQAPKRGERLMVMLKPGDGSAGGHFAIVGKDRKGFYVVDPGINRTIRFRNERELQAYMAQRKLPLDEMGEPGKKGFMVMPLTPAPTAGRR